MYNWFSKSIIYFKSSIILQFNPLSYLSLVFMQYTICAYFVQSSLLSTRGGKYNLYPLIY